jgi:hypothetical protein
MKLHRSALILVLLFAVASAGCNSPSTKSPGNRSNDTSTKPCPRTPSFTQAVTTENLPTPTAQQTGVAKPYKEIYAGLKEFRSEYNAPDYQTIRDNANSYLRTELEGKQIAGWEGWVVSTGVEAMRSLQMKWRITGSEAEDYPEDTEPFSNTVLISMENPFADAPASIATPNRHTHEIEEPYISLMGVGQASDQLICIGQKVRFDGYVLEAPEIVFERGDFIVPATNVAVIENPLPELTVPHDLADLTIQLRRIPGWVGPDYHLTLFGNGTVVFEGRYGTVVNGFRISTVSQETVHKLLSAFDKAGFSTMSETEYAEYGMSDAPSARTTLYHQGKRKSIYHYFGNNVPDEKLTQLENKTDEILHTEKWVGKQ